MAESIGIEIGTDEQGDEYSLDLTGAPHILVGGTTGSGKTTLLHRIICSLIKDYDPKNIQLYIGDPKQVDFAKYKRAPHTQAVATSAVDIDVMLVELVAEMERRFSLMRECIDKDGLQLDSVIGSYAYNSEGEEVPFPNIIVIVDEYGNLIFDDFVGQAISGNIIRLASKGRAAGINIILTTQHPTIKVVNEQIKANCPLRIAMKVLSKVNSRVILDENGAEKLAGAGQMYASSHSRIDGKVKRLIKIQCKNITKKAIEEQLKMFD